MHTVTVRNVSIGPRSPLAIIAGPCVAESRDLCLKVGQAMRDRCADLGLGYIFKASFDKANRTSARSYRGPGLDRGLALLESVSRTLGVPVTTDVHDPAQAKPVAQAVDLLQIPAFLCRQTDLLQACAATGKPVNVKKGQFLSPHEMRNVIEKLTAAQPRRKARNSKLQTRNSSTSPGLILTERGTFFGYNRLVNDFVGLADLIDLGWPVCFDVTHSIQQPGGQGNQTGGRPDRAPTLARAAVAAGVQAIFLETHPNPKTAKSDAAAMLPLPRALKLLDELQRLRDAIE